MNGIELIDTGLNVITFAFIGFLIWAYLKDDKTP